MPPNIGPANRNNNNGFRPASTLPCQNPQAFLLQSVPGCKVQVVVLCRAIIGWLGQMKFRPGRSGRPHGSNALPGRLTAEPLAYFGLIDSYRPPRAN
jgi:hypothetical protein